MYESITTSGHLRYQAQRPKVQSSWSVLLDERLSTHARSTALFVAERMRDADFVSVIAAQATLQAIFPSGWSAASFAAGEAGMALMYEYMDRYFPGQGWNAWAQDYLRRAAAGSRQSALLLPALFSDTGGMALVVAQASREGKRYQKTLAQLHKGLCEQVIGTTWRRPIENDGVAAEDYDLISGAAGVLAYLVSIEQPDELVYIAIERLLEYLTWLAEPTQPIGKEHWYIPVELLPDNGHRQEFPEGNFNCGLAHGIPGPLAALALTWLAGYRYPGLCESISYLSHWILEHSLSKAGGLDWPQVVPFEAAASVDAWKSLPATRTAWCYGTPGVSRALWLAGKALEDDHLKHIAVEAIESVLRRPVSQRHIPSPHICHGVAGLLQICLRFAHECESALVKEHIPLLVEQLLDAFDPTFPLGFRDIDQGVPVDQPAWLTGAPGVAMALLAASMPVEPSWDRVLAIA